MLRSGDKNLDDFEDSTEETNEKEVEDSTIEASKDEQNPACLFDLGFGSEDHLKCPPGSPCRNPEGDEMFVDILALLGLDSLDFINSKRKRDSTNLQESFKKLKIESDKEMPIVKLDDIAEDDPKEMS